MNYSVYGQGQPLPRLPGRRTASSCPAVSSKRRRPSTSSFRSARSAIVSTCTSIPMCSIDAAAAPQGHRRAAGGGYGIRRRRRVSCPTALMSRWSQRRPDHSRRLKDRACSRKCKPACRRRSGDLDGRHASSRLAGAAQATAAWTGCRRRCVDRHDRRRRLPASAFTLPAEQRAHRVRRYADRPDSTATPIMLPTARTATLPAGTEVLLAAQARSSTIPSGTQVTLLRRRMRPTAVLYADFFDADRTSHTRRWCSSPIRSRTSTSPRAAPTRSTTGSCSSMCRSPSPST